MTKRLGAFVHDLRINRDFLDELRFGRLIEKYGGTGFLAVMLLWRWAAVNQPTTGRLEDMDGTDILRLSKVDVNKQEYLDDLLKWGFLRRDENGCYLLPDWAEEQPYVAKAEERSQAGRAAVEKRWAARAAREIEKPAKLQDDTAPSTGVLGEVYSNTNSKAFKSPPSPPKGGESEVPVNEIAEIYADVLPELPKPVLTPKVQRDITSRWAADPSRQCLEWWREYFGRVRTMPRLMGEGDDKLCASLGWLVNRGCMDKILAGQYLTRVDATRQPPRCMSDEEFERMRAAEAAPG